MTCINNSANRFWLIVQFVQYIVCNAMHASKGTDSFLFFFVDICPQCIVLTHILALHHILTAEKLSTSRARERQSVFMRGLSGPLWAAVQWVTFYMTHCHCSHHHHQHNF